MKITDTAESLNALPWKKCWRNHLLNRTLGFYSCAFPAFHDAS